MSHSQSAETGKKPTDRPSIYPSLGSSEEGPRYFTLNVGDLIFTGTPGGVGVFRKPPMFLKDADEVVVEIEGLGSLTNTVRSNGAPAAKRARL